MVWLTECFQASRAGRRHSSGAVSGTGGSSCECPRRRGTRVCSNAGSPALRLLGPVHDVRVVRFHPGPHGWHDLLGIDGDADRNGQVDRSASRSSPSRCVPNWWRCWSPNRTSGCRAVRRGQTFSGCPSQSVHAQNFSRIHAAWPAGESARPYPTVCGRVACCLE